MATETKDLVERARIESVSFNTTDYGRSLFYELAQEIERLRELSDYWQTLYWALGSNCRAAREGGTT